MTGPILRTMDLRKSFGELEVLKGIDLTVEPGERIAIIGGSGSGKSTLLRCLNFMELPTAGRVELDGALIGQVQTARDGTERITYAERALTQVRRRVGMVFQQFNLFPHMTVLQNTMEGLITVDRMPRQQARERAMAELARVGLAEKLGAYPSQLSGGQQQRVAIARALAMQPEVLLFDEPTSSLDPELVGEVLRTIHTLAEEGRTMLLVTHELGFAYRFATRVLYLYDGLVHEEGTAEQIFRAPQREKTRAFIERSSEFSL
ncbi:amino acid ABC transporter ATP-binding protein, PAAT family [Gemmobacter megaterium]|uniref:Amino acid ABC transporter ATP-binding protein, PAAT family n=1 Tax=Gemmobacter megaterium TaxID=1086013 RepID=A0A1N7N9E5_9RHOB|nr:amino acid ABC transporter ATP-binding protein [Gemmobacter megaterium]GGE13761.1 nopaline permease ATP-binding protein P [Gemmobacter megaterium]SIS94974.1 amino acid ABC transporter ATP-binding protein, PAAT family [Gemmobacter megaterium]